MDVLERAPALPESGTLMSSVHVVMRPERTTPSIFFSPNRFGLAEAWLRARSHSSRSARRYAGPSLERTSSSPVPAAWSNGGTNSMSMPSKKLAKAVAYFVEPALLASISVRRLDRYALGAPLGRWRLNCCTDHMSDGREMAASPVTDESPSALSTATERRSMADRSTTPTEL